MWKLTCLVLLLACSLVHASTVQHRLRSRFDPDGQQSMDSMDQQQSDASPVEPVMISQSEMSEVNSNNPSAAFAGMQDPPAANEPAVVMEPTAMVETSQPSGPVGRIPTRTTLSDSEVQQDKLEVALAAIKQDILVRNRQIQDEKAWVQQVRQIVDQYNKKVNRVDADISKTKLEVKTLFRKKKQIENLKIQKALERKLKDATSDLTTLQSALAHVQTKANEFSKTKNEIKKTIVGINAQLQKLQGKPASTSIIAKNVDAADQAYTTASQLDPNINPDSVNGIANSNNNVGQGAAQNTPATAAE